MTEEQLNQVQMILRQISKDQAVPKNIRRAAKNASHELEQSNFSPAVRASNAISVLDDPSQDPNCPIHARTKIWQIVAMLEKVHDEPE